MGKMLSITEDGCCFRFKDGEIDNLINILVVGLDMSFNTLSKSASSNPIPLQDDVFAYVAFDNREHQATVDLKVKNDGNTTHQFSFDVDTAQIQRKRPRRSDILKLVENTINAILKDNLVTMTSIARPNPQVQLANAS